MTDCTDVISCHVLNAVSSHRHWAKPAPLTHICPFTTKVMQSHLMAEIGTRSNLMTLPSGPRVDDSQSGEGVMIKKCTKTTIRTKTNNIINLLWGQALFLLSSFWLHTLYSWMEKAETGSSSLAKLESCLRCCHVESWNWTDYLFFSYQE